MTQLPDKPDFQQSSDASFNRVSQYFILLFAAILIYPFLIYRISFWHQTYSSQQISKTEELKKLELGEYEKSYSSDYDSQIRHTKRVLYRNYFILFCISSFFIYRIYKIRRL